MACPPPALLARSAVSSEGTKREALAEQSAHSKGAAAAADARAWELRHGKGLTVPQVAARLGRCESAVKKMLTRERARRVNARLPVPPERNQLAPGRRSGQRLQVLDREFDEGPGIPVRIGSARYVHHGDGAGILNLSLDEL